MLTLINARRFSLSIVRRFSFGYWNENGLATVDAGFICAEFVTREPVADELAEPGELVAEPFEFGGVDIGSGVRLVDAVGVVAFVTIVGETGREYIAECRTLGVFIIPRHAIQFDCAGAFAAEFKRDELPVEPIDALQVW